MQILYDHTHPRHFNNAYFYHKSHINTNSFECVLLIIRLVIFIIRYHEWRLFTSGLLNRVFTLYVSGVICYELSSSIHNYNVAGQPRKQLASHQFFVGHAEALLWIATRQRVAIDLQTWIQLSSGQ